MAADSTPIAARLLARRTAKGLSQTDLAAAAQVSRNTVSALERGQLKAHPPRLDNWCHLLTALELPVGETTEAACEELA